MATYEDIYGKRVKEFDSEPTLESSYEGQVWYDKSTGVLKSVVAFDSFTSSTPYTTGRRSFGSSGTQTANLIYAGSTGSANDATEEYDGSGWTSSGAFGSAGYGVRGMGTQTAALSAGLFPPGGVNASTYKYDGSTWTSAGSLPAARAVMGTAGTQTAGLAFGGSTGPFANTANGTYEYDGSSWTAGNNMGTARTYLAGFGTQTAAAGCGGYTGSPANSNQTGATEEYDGTNWSASGSMNTARRAFATSGIQTAGLAMGGTTGSDSAVTEKYDGSTWATSSATLGTATRNNGGSPAGTQSAAISTEGGGSPYGAKTEEFNASINTFTAAAWSSTPAVNTGRGLLAGGGTATAGLIFGGNTSASINYVNNSEEWDGTSWTEGNDLATARGNGIGGCGTQTAGLAFCGDVHPTSPRNTADTEEYDGSSWSEANDVNTARRGTAGAGIQTAAVMAGGYSTTNINNTEEYDGTNWSNGNTMPYSRANITIAGTQTAAILAAGSPASPTATLEYDGTNWTASAAYPAMPVYSVGSSGIQTAALFFGGFSPPPVIATTVGYDGTSFSSRPSMGTARYGVGPTSAGPSTSTIAAAGASYPSPAALTVSEEFSGGTETVTAKTLTSS